MQSASRAIPSPLPLPFLSDQFLQPFKFLLVLPDDFNKGRQHGIAQTSEQRTQHLLRQPAFELFTSITRRIDECLSVLFARQIAFTMQTIESRQHCGVRDLAAAAECFLHFRDSLIRLPPKNLHHLSFQFSEHLFDAPVTWSKPPQCNS